MATLDGAFRQLTWAEECLVKIKARVENVGKFQNDIMRPKIHKDGAISYSAPNRVPELTHDVGLMLQALRSALDYLIRGLSIHDSGGRKPKHKTQFLIEDDPKVFESRIATRLEGLSDEHIALIRQLQPCHGCNWTRTLRDLNDRQKHNDVIELISIGSARTHISHFAIQTDAQGHTILPGAVEVQHLSPMKVTFADGAPIVETLEILQSQVSDLLVKFNALFQD